MNFLVLAVVVGSFFAAAPLRAEERLPECAVDVQTAKPSDYDLYTRYQQIRKAGFTIARTGRAKSPQGSLAIFHVAECSARASALGKALGVDRRNIRPATGQTRHGITVIFPGRGWANEAEASCSAVSPPSRYGTFEVAFNDAEQVCSLFFQRPKSSPELVMRVESCYSTDGCASGSHSIIAGTEGVPITAQSSEEFHLFSIETARGGNMCAGQDYYAVVVDAGRVWATPELFGGCATIATPRLEETGRSKLVLEVPPTTAIKRSRRLVSMGDIADTTLPPATRVQTSGHERVLTGQVVPGGHVDNWRPAVGGTTIHEDGECDLKHIEDGSTITMHVLERVFDDGHTVVTCVRVE